MMTPSLALNFENSEDGVLSLHQSMVIHRTPYPPVIVHRIGRSSFPFTYARTQHLHMTGSEILHTRITSLPFITFLTHSLTPPFSSPSPLNTVSSPH
jgi:hypothetical protein